MKIYLAAVFLALSIPLLSSANDNQCVDLFAKTYKANDFLISIEGKKQSKRFLESAHSELIANDDPAQLKVVLSIISDLGVPALTPEQRQFIFTFRQNSSMLRSIFQTSDKRHLSPEKFGKFVRDFGVLKDFLLMEDDQNAQLSAIKIIEKYDDLNFEKVLKHVKPASKRSVAEYFKRILEHSKDIMSKSMMTVDEVHDVRKHLRDVLRFLQVEKDLTLEREESLSEEKENAISFLKKLNTKLGFVCDEHAAQILREKDLRGPFKFTKKTLVVFPEDLRPKVEHFLAHYRIEIPE